MSPRPVAEHEIQRILALVPWIVAHPGTTKPEIAQRFAIDEGQVDTDLALVLMIGVPPYSPGDYLDVEEDDSGHVSIRLADYFRAPLRLTPAEGLALLAAGRALLAVPGSDPEGPLAGALAKLERVLSLPELHVDVGEPSFLADVQRAAARHERLEIDYWSANRDEITTRRVDADPPFFAMGQWYVSAFCHRAGDERLFRIDRIRAARSTGERFEPATDRDPPPVFQPSPSDPSVTLVLPATATWVLDSAPTTGVTTLPDGRLSVVLVVSERAWLERLLLRLGSEAQVVEPPEWRGAARAAARRVRARYGADPGPGSGA